MQFKLIDHILFIASKEETSSNNRWASGKINMRMDNLGWGGSIINNPGNLLVTRAVLIGDQEFDGGATITLR